MRKNILLICSILILLACKSGVPKDVIAPEKMKDILINIHVVDGYLMTYTSVDSSRKSGSVYYNSIYKHFGVDSAQYAHSLIYYNQNPKKLSAIYQEVTADLDKILKEEEKLDKQNVISQ